jgi:iron complex outermembrane receptor protein
VLTRQLPKKEANMQLLPRRSMRRQAIAPIALMATSMFSSAALAQTPAQPVLEELIVTAQKRAEDLQSVPVSVQALGTERLDQLNVQDFDDFIQFLPSAVFRQSFETTQVYMRGVASGADGNHSASQPSVGVYVDEQPVTTIQGSLNINVYDFARVEALAGPQGTLFGASSQAGTIRMITNKPVLNDQTGGLDVSVNSIDHGGIGYSVEGFANLPISDRAAIRLVGWDRHDAGYIDNVHGTRTFPTSGATDDNAAFVKKDYNDSDTVGARAALKIDLDDNWTITPSLMAQSQERNGVGAFDPAVGDLKLQHYHPETGKDRWAQAALTIEGKIGNFDVVYAGAHLKRKTDADFDYSDYAYHYDTQTTYGAYWVDDLGNPTNPSQYFHSQDQFTKTSHELRFASPDENRLRVIAGLFYQEQQDKIFQQYRINNLGSAIEVPGYADTIWLTRQIRKDTDKAIFGEISFDATDKLTLTGGLRLFKAESNLKGFFGYGAGFSGSTGEAACFGPAVVSGSPCTNVNKSTSESDHTYKINATYQIDPDRMVYATVSTGYRPGGVNRRGSLPPYQSDFLTNYEFGWKTQWMDDRLRWNGAVFFEKWEDFQFAILGQNGLTEIKNAAQAEIRGFETDLTYAATDNLRVSGSLAYTDAKLSENYCGYVKPGTNTPETSCPNAGNSAAPEAPSGQQLPITPKLKFNLTARYQFDLAGHDSFVQGSLLNQSSSWPELRTVQRSILGRLDGYTQLDVSAGTRFADWSLEAFIKNVADERGEVSRYAECPITVCGVQTYIVPIQPRTIGLKLGRKF